jgi:hypothetical protein
MTKIAGSGSISQRHGSADPDPDPDTHQYVMDPQDCRKLTKVPVIIVKKKKTRAFHLFGSIPVPYVTVPNPQHPCNG